MTFLAVLLAPILVHLAPFEKREVTTSTTQSFIEPDGNIRVYQDGGLLQTMGRGDNAIPLGATFTLQAEDEEVIVKVIPWNIEIK